MPDPTRLVNEFHKFFGLPTPDGPRLLSGDELDFRMDLLDEEFNELEAELVHGERGDLAKQYKEAADLAYVLYGWDQHAGGALSAVLEAVHESNMSKLWECWDCDGRGYLWDGESFSEDAGGRLYTRCAGCQETGRRPKYREDGKVLKSPSYNPPDIQKVLDDFFMED